MQSRARISVQFGRFARRFTSTDGLAFGVERTWAGFAGIEYQITERVAVDFSGQRFGLAGGNPDRQLVVGLTMNFGKLQ